MSGANATFCGTNRGLGGWFTLVAVCALIFGGVFRAHAQDIHVFVDGDRVHFDEVGPQQMDGRVLVPVRGVLEMLGANVDWNPDTQRVTANNGDIDIVLHIGERRARVNNRDVMLDVPAQTIGGHTMVPLRFLSESLGAKVRWDGSERTVFIMTPDAGRRFRAHRDNDMPRDPDQNRDRDRNRDDNPQR